MYSDSMSLGTMIGIFVVVVFAFGALKVGCESATADTVRSNATTDARAYARAMHPAWSSPAVDCQGVDSDADGYVRCVVGDGANATEAIECRTSIVFAYQRGCVPMRAIPRTTN